MSQCDDLLLTWIVFRQAHVKTWCSLCKTCRDASSKYISLRLESRNSVLTCSRKIIPSVSIYQPPAPIPSVRKSARMFIETHMCEKFFNFSIQMFQKQTSVDWLAGGFKYITFNFSPPPKIEVRWVKPSKSSTIDGPAAYFSVDSWWFSDHHPPVIGSVECRGAFGTHAALVTIERSQPSYWVSAPVFVDVGGLESCGKGGLDLFC